MEKELPGDLPSVIGDEESLVRVLINIIGNATKYTPSGGRIHIAAEYDDLDVTISISDTGAGIPHDKLPFIFDPFFRGKGKRRPTEGFRIGAFLLQENNGGSWWQNRCFIRRGERNYLHAEISPVILRGNISCLSEFSC